VDDPKTTLRDKSAKLRIPFIQKGTGKAMDINIAVDEGEKFRCRKSNSRATKPLSIPLCCARSSPLKTAILSTRIRFRRASKTCAKPMVRSGISTSTSVPETEINDEKKVLTLNVDVEEGKPFFVRRIEFQGNTTTRDKVIRRDLLGAGRPSVQQPALGLERASSQPAQLL